MKHSLVGLGALVAVAALVAGCGSRRSIEDGVGGRPASGGSGGSGGAGHGGGPAGGTGLTGTPGSGGHASGGAGAGSGGAGTGGAGAGGAVGNSGIDGTKIVGTLAVPDRQKLCDWDANLTGGYGKTTTCDGFSVSNDTSQADCLASWPTHCQAAVSAYESCAKELAVDPCDPLTAAFSPSCQMLSDTCAE